ncbi:MAG TPA: LysM peptidoglycan-binding domain-containing protein [Cyclobacteriaceae bacterium]|jgi:LysM repeat protein|nr:LysM peptidoglycan-binding domain-containing protein [Cyclobacteriaceae bacterium]
MVNSKLKIQEPGFTIQILLPCILCLLSIVAWATPVDSLRLETINGKQFIIHQVDPKETLYSISRKYGVAVALIREENPTVDAGLAVGQIVKVPYTPRTKPKFDNGTIVHKVTTKETLYSISRMYDVSVDDLKGWNNLKDNSLSVGQDLIIRKKSKPEISKIPDPKTVRGVHTVTENETLFSISKMYGASVQQLKEWNNLTSSELKPGQTIFVLPPVHSMPETNRQTEVTQTAPITAKPANEEIKISESVIGADEIHEKGAAELIEGTDGNRKYLAQHRTAKVGTIMKVRNETTNREVFVRIVGPLNTDGGTVIKVSKSAFDRLGATDPRFNVELIYYK